MHTNYPLRRSCLHDPLLFLRDRLPHQYVILHELALIDGELDLVSVEGRDEDMVVGGAVLLPRQVVELLSGLSTMRRLYAFPPFLHVF